MTATINDNVLYIRRAFKAPQKKLFNAFTDIRTFEKWWGHEGMDVDIEALDAKVGGTWATTLTGDSNKPMRVAGVFERVDPFHTLVFSWAWDDEHNRPGHCTRVTIEFTPQGDDLTMLELTQEVFQTEESGQQHAKGWAATFTRLDKVLAQ